MIEKKWRLPARAAPVALSLGLVAIALGASEATSHSGPLSCTIDATTADGMITLESSIQSDVAVNGSYRFRVASAAHSGSANIQQGGGFAAMPGQPARLSRVMLGDASAIYDATLEVVANSASVTCTKQVGGKI